MRDTNTIRADGIGRGREVTIRVDGHSVAACEGEMLAAALMAAGFLRLRASPNARTPRGAFCLMGVCQECAISIDGTIRQACQVRVHEGLDVELRGVL
ncbi:MAG: 2Fe-2S iron-sulfur cluster-binding protein [Hyphomicrobiaceae bacterium]